MKIEQPEIEETEQPKRDPNAIIPLASLLTTTFDEIESRAMGTSISGIPTNFYDFDAMTQGLQRGDLIVIGGRPAMGKTSFSLQMAKNIAQIHSLPVCIFGLEMSKEQLSYRLLAMETGIESERLRAGRIQADEWEFVGEGINKLGELPIFISDQRNITVKEILEKSENIKEEWGKELGLVLIDYLQLMDGPPYETRDEELAKVVIAIKNMAIKLDVPVVLMSQLERELEYRENKRPMLSDLRETQAMEEHADIISMIYRDEYYNPETIDRGIT